MSETTAPAAPPAAPAFVPVSRARWFLYFLASLTFGLTQGLGSNLIAANIQAVQGTFGVNTSEATWLTAAYSATSVTASLLLFKIRTQFGLRLVAKIGLLFFLAVALTHFVADDLRSAVVVRAVAGFAASPLGTLALLYMLEVLPPEKKLTVGIAVGLAGAQVAVPLARLISPDLLEIGLWDRLNMLELALSALSLAWIFLLPITPPPRMKIFDRVDAISMPLLVIGMGLLAVVLSLGRFYWWLEAPWLGVCLAGAIGALTLLVVIELNRERPLINLHWLSSTDMLLFAGSMFLARFVLAEQTTGTVGFFQNLGLLNEQMTGMLLVITLATLAGFWGVAFFNTPGNRAAIHIVALSLISVGAWLQSDATSLTRPQDVLLAQGLVAFGGAIFLPPALSWAFGHALKSGIPYLTSFFAVFLTSQTLGGLIGSAGLGTLVTIREKFHSNQIVENLVLTDPQVVGRISQYGAAYARVLNDPALRSAEGSALLAQVATREAYVLAYNDLFLVVSVVSALCLFGLILHLFLAWVARRGTVDGRQAA